MSAGDQRSNPAAGSDDESPRSGRALIMLLAASAGLLCGATWMLPGLKDNAALGRYTYGQLMVAFVATAIFVSLVTMAFASIRNRRALLFRLLTVWLAVCLPLAILELAAVLLPPLIGVASQDSRTG